MICAPDDEWLVGHEDALIWLPPLLERDRVRFLRPQRARHIGRKWGRPFAFRVGKKGIGRKERRGRPLRGPARNGSWRFEEQGLIATSFAHSRLLSRTWQRRS